MTEHIEIVGSQTPGHGAPVDVACTDALSKQGMPLWHGSLTLGTAQRFLQIGCEAGATDDVGQFIMSMKSAGPRCGPRSSATIDMPARVSSSSITPPPAPVPITQTSNFSLRGLAISASFQFAQSLDIQHDGARAYLAATASARRIAGDNGQSCAAQNDPSRSQSYNRETKLLNIQPCHLGSTASLKAMPRLTPLMPARPPRPISQPLMPNPPRFSPDHARSNMERSQMFFWESGLLMRAIAKYSNA